MAGARLRTVLGQIRTVVDPKGRAEATDRELLECMVAGSDEEAIAALLRRHGPMVLGVCRRILGHAEDAEDVFQATFLLLVRKARSIRKRDSVSSWLYGVAHRLALRLKVQRTCRQAHERRAAALRATTTPGLETACSELEAALDDALGRLPEKYRAALLLCYFEGRTLEEAARALGCPWGTIASRLAQGRRLLRDRLVRRGLVLSPTALGTFLLAGTSPGAIPLTLAHATRRAVQRLATGDALATVTSKPVALLIKQQGTTAMLKMKLFLAAILAVGLAVAARVGAGDGLPSAVETPDKPAGQKSAQPAAQQPPDQRPVEASAIVRGRARTLDGKPVPAAKLFLINNDGLLSEVGATGDDGRFAVDVPRSEARSGKLAWLAVKAPGLGVDFAALHKRPAGEEIELHLPPDRPIRGRVIDLQGKPVAGATIRLSALSVYGDNSVEPFLAGLLKRPNFRSAGATADRAMFGGTRKLLTATTDRDGQFEFVGAGAERLVSLRITGPGISQTSAEIITRTGFDPAPYNAATLALRPKGTGEQLSWGFNPLLLGPDPTVIAEAEKPVRGIVTAADTGKPRAGVRVVLDQDNGSQCNRVEATTDKDGRYEVRGAFKAPSYTLTVESDPATGMLRRGVTVSDTTGYEPLTADIKTARGVVVTGRVTDGATRKPVPGRVWIAALFDNVHVRKPEYDSFDDVPAEYTGPDGTFRIVAIPGPVLLMAGPDYGRLPGGMLEGLRYRPPVADPPFPDYFRSDTSGLSYHAVGQGNRIVRGTTCKVLDIKPGVAEVRADLVLARATGMLLSLRDAAGRPVAGTWVDGVNAWRFTEAHWCESANVEVYGVAPGGAARLFACFDPKSKLIGTVNLKGDEKQPVVVTLEQSGILKGRLLNSDGSPAAGVTVSAEYADHAAQNVFKQAQEPDGCVMTDKNGAFRFDRLIPGQPFALLTSPPSREGLFRMPTQSVGDGRMFGPVNAGESIDLGDLTLESAKPQADE